MHLPAPLATSPLPLGPPAAGGGRSPCHVAMGSRRGGRRDEAVADPRAQCPRCGLGVSRTGNTSRCVRDRHAAAAAVTGACAAIHPPAPCNIFPAAARRPRHLGRLRKATIEAGVISTGLSTVHRVPPSSGDPPAVWGPTEAVWGRRRLWSAWPGRVHGWRRWSHTQAVRKQLLSNGWSPSPPLQIRAPLIGRSLTLAALRPPRRRAAPRAAEARQRFAWLATGPSDPAARAGRPRTCEGAGSTR
eukprot:scaffold1988_cov270-Prasinococcus_capsulatus_cf.AAC.10